MNVSVPIDSYFIDLQKTKDYLKQIENRTHRQIAEIIIEHTEHVSFLRFMALLEICGKRFMDYIQVRPWILVIPDEKKSEMWTWSLLKKSFPLIIAQLRGIVTLTEPSDALGQDVEVVFLDDAYFTVAYCETMMRRLAEKHSLNTRTITFVAPCVSSAILEYSSTHRINVIDAKRIDPLKHFLTQYQCKELERMLTPRGDSHILYEDQHAIYFDHKLPGEQASLPQIYQHILPIIPTPYRCEPHQCQPFDDDAILRSFTYVTSNANKLAEVRSLLEGYKVKVYSVDLPVPEIQGEPVEIILAKARYASEVLGRPVLVDDTSLGFTMLGGLPGPYIRHFFDKLGNKGLVSMLETFPDKSAVAMCLLGYCDQEAGSLKVFCGECRGVIVPSDVVGTFGWDAIFRPDGYGLTFHELGFEAKNRISHRSRALAQLKMNFYLEKPESELVDE